uniref:Tetratricopeptide repeat domain 6 n=1 Tax=Otus sunia TaxID=257818 RepID=A0A8C8BGK2_9STRI
SFKESFTSQPVQQAFIQSFCQNHNKPIECLCEATATHPEPSMFVILGKIQMKAKKTKVRKFTLYICQVRHIFFCILLIFYEIWWFFYHIIILFSSLQAYMSCAAYYGSKGRYSKAILNCNEAIKILPNRNLYMENGHEAGYKQAQSDFLRAIHLNPKCIKARICVGYNLQDDQTLKHTACRGCGVSILEDIKNLTVHGPGQPAPTDGETFAAFQDTNATIKLTTTAPLLTNRGVINELMGYLPCAMKDYQQAISVDTNYALAYFNAAYCYYSKVLQLDPRNESAVMNCAITNTLLNNIEEAKEDLEKAICLCPFSAAVCFNRANLYALSIQPNDALMYKFRADIRSKLGFNKEAVEDYKQAISSQEQIDSM